MECAGDDAVAQSELRMVLKLYADDVAYQTAFVHFRAERIGRARAFGEDAKAGKSLDGEIFHKELAAADVGDARVGRVVPVDCQVAYNYCVGCRGVDGDADAYGNVNGGDVAMASVNRQGFINDEAAVVAGIKRANLAARVSLQGCPGERQAGRQASAGISIVAVLRRPTSGYFAPAPQRRARA